MSGPRRRAAPTDAGQATVELVALVPVVVAVALAVAAVLGAGAARHAAAGAAQAGALALLQDRPPEPAARASLGGWPRRLARVEVRGARVTVRLRPRFVLPGLAGTLTATETANAGALGSDGAVWPRGGDGAGAEERR